MSKSSLALSNLRAVVILIVLAFHSVLAYLDFLPAKPYPFSDPPFKWQAFPIIDSQRWMGFDGPDGRAPDVARAPHHCGDHATQHN